MSKPASDVDADVDVGGGGWCAVSPAEKTSFSTSNSAESCDEINGASIAKHNFFSNSGGDVVTMRDTSHRRVRV